MKILINRCFGGYGLSKAVYDELISAKAIPDTTEFDVRWNCFDCNLKRNDPALIAAVEKVGLENAGGNFAELKIVEVPDDIDWEIHDYDGMESVREKHRSWK